MGGRRRYIGRRRPSEVELRAVSFPRATTSPTRFSRPPIPVIRQVSASARSVATSDDDAAHRERHLIDEKRTVIRQRV
jgi:hypothetical protein